MSTEKLIANCLQNDRSAQKEFVHLFGRYIMTICRRYIKDQHYCEDVCQVSFIKIFNKLYQYDNQKGELKSWICKITINCALEFLRSRQFKFNEINTLTEPSSNYNIAINTLFQEDLLKMLHSLNVTQRTIFNLAEIEGYSFKEIESLLKINQSTCRSHLHRAKKILSSKINNLSHEIIK